MVVGWGRTMQSSLGAALVLLAAVMAMAGERPAVAQTATAKKAIDPEQSLDLARRALATNKLDQAESLVQAVLTDDKRDPRNTARALAVRGEVRVKQKRYVEAIADLGSALWVKGGLAGNERRQAEQARATALSATGLAAQATPPVSPSPPAVSASATATAPSRPEAQERVAVEKPVKPVVVAAAPMPVATPPRPVAPTEGWKVETAVAPGNPSPAAPSANSGIGSFFSNLFGLSSDKSGTTASTSPVTSALPRTPRAEPNRVVATSSFPVRSVELPRRKPLPPERSKVANVAVVAPGLGGAEPAKGHVLQLAAVRSKEDAEALLGVVRKHHPGFVDGRGHEVKETVFGNMGRFYRLRIGPFENIVESKAVCASLRNRGHDCMVVDH